MRRPPTRTVRLRWFVIGGIALAILLFSGSAANFFTEVLWFTEVGYRQVFTTQITAKFYTGGAAGLVALIFLWVNLFIARRAVTGPRIQSQIRTPMDQWREIFAERSRLIAAAVAVGFGIITAFSASAMWETVLLWLNGQPFGVNDPQFGRDIGWFVFTLPFQRFVLATAIGITVLTLFVVAGAYLLGGGIDLPGQGRPVIHWAVPVHTSVLLGILWLLKAWGYRLQAFELVYSPRGTVTGASYTDVHAQLPALMLLSAIAVISAVVFFANFFPRFRGFVLPVVALALWAFASIALGAIYPAVTQRFTVEPNESELEQPFIERNIEATRAAFGLDKIDVGEFPAKPGLNAEVVAANSETVENMRVWDPVPLKQAYDQQQRLRQYYEFNDVDIDRYTIDGKLRQVLLSGREVNTDKLDARSKSWINEKLSFTHGYGFVASPANAGTDEGRPQLLVSDLPLEGPAEIVPEQASIYYGESLSGYVIADTLKAEIDHPEGTGVKTSTYAGDGGVELSSLVRRLAFAARFGDFNIVISDRLKPDSKLIMHRNIRDRISTIAPFLLFDHDPYLVAMKDRLVWVQDAYTVTDKYPYSQEVNLGPLVPGASGNINYMRNSVKVVVDAYDGAVDLYTVPPADPIAATYAKAFPGLFKPIDEMPDELRSHLRYPEDLFIVQTNQYGLYHMTDASQFYQREDVWEVPDDPVRSNDANRVPLEPYYVVMKLPDADKAEFLLMQPFTPANNPVLNGWMAARSDPEHYGELVAFSFPRGTAIPGPVNVSALINQDDKISQQLTLWGQSGSQVLEGSLLVVPIGESLIYVQPLYLQAEKGAIPQLERVVVFYDGKIGFERTFEQSLARVIGANVEPTEPVSGSGTGGSGTNSEAVATALRHLEAADRALRDGDLAGYQREIEAARAALSSSKSDEPQPSPTPAAG